MALSDEWEKVHLTPNGWVDGSYKHDHGHRETKDMPLDALLTAYRRVVVAAIGAKPNVTMEETAHTTDKDLIAKLLKQYGPPTFGV
jgi:hypothetical protein